MNLQNGRRRDLPPSSGVNSDVDRAELAWAAEGLRHRTGRHLVKAAPNPTTAEPVWRRSPDD